MTTPSAVADARHSLRALGAVAWEHVPPAELPGVMVELERMRAQLDAARVDVAGLLEQSGAANDVGWASTKDFLTAVAGGRKGAGGGLLRLAAGLEGLPEVRAALREGRLSSDQARTIVNRVAQLPRVDEVRRAAARSFLEKACDLDATDLDRAWPTVVAEIDPDGTLLGGERDLPRSERAAHRARFLALTPDELGGVWVKGYADAESVEEVKAALLPLAAPVSTEPGACGGVPVDLAAGRRGRPARSPGVRTTAATRAKPGRGCGMRWSSSAVAPRRPRFSPRPTACARG
ncbi:DUF222 domain-containing protein [Nocardioides aquiterrae]|uniref:DUF222 domain-containing protein n=1 Tax=Nocardioides aquiterrae TaxID=203799 RepID=A0ABN1UEQ2_9ACTN